MSLSSVSSNITVQYPYAKRTMQFLMLHSAGPWRLKVYSIQHEDRPQLTVAAALQDELVQAALERATTYLQGISTTDHYGVGFVILHQAREANFLLVDWWTEENTLAQALYMSQFTAPQQFEVVTSPALVGCVWEMQIQSFEKDAWIQYVLTNAQADTESYLTATLDGIF
ncbi:MAG: isochorismatase [Deinococcota bacterium]